MIRVFLFLLAVLVLAAGLHWLADRPGTITIEWLGYIAETSVFRALVILATALALVLAAWSALRQMWRSPAAVGRYFDRRRQKRGLDALTGGIIAVGAGDRALAVRYASLARKALPHEPLTHLLRAQAAQIGGDRATARRIFEAMLASPDTEQLGLRGLFLEAEREGAPEAARQFAERALQRNPRLGWPVESLFDLQCRAADWQGALETLVIARRQNFVDKAVASRRRAVLLTAQAQALEDGDPDKAAEQAQEAHRLAPDLIPAAAIAGRILASRGNTPRAARVILKTWRVAPHPDLAAAYAYARPGDSPRDRLVRVRHLARLTPGHAEALIAVAISAIEAREWEEARRVLQPLLENHATQRVCTLMARIEGEQHADTGRVREWLARATVAARDPAWVSDGVVSQRWAAISPVTGTLDTMHWQVPGTGGPPDTSATAALAARMEALAGLGPAPDGRLHGAAAEPRTATAPAPPGGRPEYTLEPQPGRIAPPARAHDEHRRELQEEHAPAPSPRTQATVQRAPGEQLGAQIEHSDAPYRRRPPDARPPADAATRQPAETKIFVPPRAPDDPGPEPAEPDNLGPVGFPASGVKA